MTLEGESVGLTSGKGLSIANTRHPSSEAKGTCLVLGENIGPFVSR